MFLRGSVGSPQGYVFAQRKGTLWGYTVSALEYINFKYSSTCLQPEVTSALQLLSELPGPPQIGPPPATGSGQWIGHGIPSPGRPAARTPWEVNLSALWGRGGGLGFGRKDFRRQEIGGWRSSGEHRKVYITQAFAGVKRRNLLHSRPGTEPLPLLIPATKQRMIGDTASCADRGIISC